MRSQNFLIFAIIMIALSFAACNGEPTLGDPIGGDADASWELIVDQSSDKVDVIDETPTYECRVDSDCTADKACINGQCRTVTQTGDSDSVDQADQSDLGEQAKACYTGQDCLDLLGDCQVAACQGADPDHGLFGQCHVTDDPRCSGDTDHTEVDPEPEPEPEQAEETEVCQCPSDQDPCTEDYCDDNGDCQNLQIPYCWTCQSNEQCAGISSCDDGDRIHTHPTSPHCIFSEGHGTGRCDLYFEECGMYGCFDGQCIQPSEGDSDTVENTETETDVTEIEQTESSEQDYYVACSTYTDCETFGICNGNQAIRGNDCVSDESGSGRHCTMIYEWCSDNCEYGLCVIGGDTDDETACTSEQRVCLDGTDAAHLSGTCEQVCPEDETIEVACTDHSDCEAIMICAGDVSFRGESCVYSAGDNVGHCTITRELCGSVCGFHADCLPEGDYDESESTDVTEELEINLPYSDQGLHCVFSGCEGQQALYWWGATGGSENRINCGEVLYLPYSGICGWNDKIEFHFNSSGYNIVLDLICNPGVEVDLIETMEGTTKRRAIVTTTTCNR
jgi:hypothetical protein